MEWSVEWHPKLLADGRPFVSVEGLVGAVLRQHLATHAVTSSIVERHLHDEFSDHPLTFAEQLGSLVTTRERLAQQVLDWTAGRRSVLGHGRAEDDVELVDALYRARELRLATLLEELAAAGVRLLASLRDLTDDHLRATVQDVVRGREPLAAFLTRSALDDEIAWLVEMRRTLADLNPDRGAARAGGATGPTRSGGVGERTEDGGTRA